MLRGIDISNVKRKRSFDEKVAFHLHNAIVNDLNDLLKEFPKFVIPSKNTVLALQSEVFPSELNVSFCTVGHTVSPLSPLIVCQVQFKHICRNYALPAPIPTIRLGEFVIVQSFVDKSQEDLGVVVQAYSAEEFAIVTEMVGPSEDADENKVGKILRIAVSDERKVLPIKAAKEIPLLKISQNFVERTKMQMSVYGVEWQFDGNVLFVYYVSQDRVDFRPLVKHLISLQSNKIRVQMKKTNQCREFVPKLYASRALSTGHHQTVDQL